MPKEIITVEQVNYLPYILFAAASHGFIFALVLFTSRRGFYTANIVLGILVLSLSLELFTSIENLFPSLISFIEINPVIFLYGPLLYLYILLTTRKNKREYSSFIYAILPVYGIPLILYCYSYISFAFHFSSGFEIQSKANSHILWLNTIFSSSVILVLFILNTGLYLILSLGVVKKYAKEIKLKFSSIEKITYKWVCLMVYIWMAVLAVFALFFILHLLSICTIQNVFMNLRITLAFVVFIIGYFNLRYPLFYQYPMDDFEENGLKTENGSTTVKQGNNDPDRSIARVNSRKKQMILKFIKEEKPYLNSNLTINELAQNLNMHYKTLSKILSTEFGCTFYDLINKYRVNEVKIKLKDVSNATSTIMTIAYSCGFNSKSSFNTLFKKLTGETPSEFRKKKESRDGV